MEIGIAASGSGSESPSGSGIGSRTRARGRRGRNSKRNVTVTRSKKENGSSLCDSVNTGDDSLIEVHVDNDAGSTSTKRQGSKVTTTDRVPQGGKRLRKSAFQAKQQDSTELSNKCVAGKASIQMLSRSTSQKSAFQMRSALVESPVESTLKSDSKIVGCEPSEEEAINTLLSDTGKDSQTNPMQEVLNVNDNDSSQPAKISNYESINTDSSTKTTSPTSKGSKSGDKKRKKTRGRQQGRKGVVVDPSSDESQERLRSLSSNVDKRQKFSDSHSDFDASNGGIDLPREMPRTDETMGFNSAVVEMNSLEKSQVFEISSSEVERKVLMVLQHPMEFCIKGKIKIQTLVGSLSVHGHFISMRDKTYNLFSPSCNNNLTISTVITDHKKFNKIETKLSLKSYLGKENAPVFDKLFSLLSSSSIVVVLRELKSESCDYLTSSAPYQQLFTLKGNLPGELPELNSQLSTVGVSVHRSTPSTGIYISDGFHQVAEQLVQCVTKGEVPTVVICGGKNSGKSTLARYLVNSLLNFCKNVGVFDCDPGQTEFTPPGCVSFTSVTEPLFGPPFTHLRSCSRTAFIGDLSPANDPEHYVRCLEFVYEAYSQVSPPAPLVVNTMGWNQGLGLVFMSDVMRLVRPTLVVQLDSAARHKNFPPLTRGFVCHTEGWISNNVLAEEEYDHDLLIIGSAGVSPKGKHDHFGAVEFRNMALMSYFSHALPPGGSSLNSIQPFVVPFHSVAIHVCHVTVPNDQIMFTLNGSVVALCSVPPDQILTSRDDSLPRFLKRKPVCHVLGFGIIRAIDPKLKVFYVISPVSTEVLTGVNCFLKGGVELPECLLLRQNVDNRASLPYVDLVPDGFSGVRQRQFLQRKRYSGPSLRE